MSVLVPIDPLLESLLGSEGKDVSQNARECIVLELYRRGTLSGGKAAELLGLEKTIFIRYASSLKIPYADPEASEIESDLSQARSASSPST